jgi:sporulation and spore germination protein
MSRHWKVAVGLLALLAFGALMTFPALLRSVFNLRRASTTAVQARRAIAQPPISTPTDTMEKAQLFWISPAAGARLEPSTVELPLSAEPEHRAKQLITALIEKAPTLQRTLPVDATLLELYLLPDGTAVADFSEALGTETPSGILSEQMAVDSIVQTLGANLSAIDRLKILIRGQEAETLAGHLDLTEFFPVRPAAAESQGLSTTSPSGAPPSVSTGTENR